MKDIYEKLELLRKSDDKFSKICNSTICEKCPISKLKAKFGIDLPCKYVSIFYNTLTEEEIEELENGEDWSQVRKDTPILVKGKEGEWYNRYFAKFENGKVYAYMGGCTSWTAASEDDITSWDYARLAKGVK